MNTGTSAGGEWVKKSHFGQSSMIASFVGCVLFVVPGMLIMFNPIDERDVYILDGKAYTADGTCVGVVASEN